WNSDPVQSTEIATGLPAGSYTVTATDNNTCTATANVTIIKPTLSSSYTATTCDSLSLPWGGSVTVSGAYIHTYINGLGCDSVVTANVTIHYSSTPTSYNATACDSYTLPWGGVVTVSGSYSHTYTNPAGCDSIVTANVTVNTSSVYYADVDGDGYGAGAEIHACGQPANTSTFNTDCNDTVFAVNPGVAEICGNGIDDNCNTQVDEDCASGVGFDVTLFIQGYMDEFNPGFMKSVLQNEIGSSDPSEVDTITIILHDEVTLEPVDTFKGLLHTDGLISCAFDNASGSGSYYISIHYRNTLETWSAAAVPMSLGHYYFSADVTQAFPDPFNPNPQMAFVAGVWAIYSGDVDQNGSIDGGDFNAMEPDVTFPNFGYNVSDITGDGIPDGQDYNLLEPNVSFGLFVARP
ncbi:MAG: putative metal-binding motif-containing protein, partial [Chitinophagales bacterium]